MNPVGPLDAEILAAAVLMVPFFDGIDQKLRKCKKMFFFKL